MRFLMVQAMWLMLRVELLYPVDVYSMELSFFFFIFAPRSLILPPRLATVIIWQDIANSLSDFEPRFLWLYLQQQKHVGTRI
mmetsp:Transcript_10003/g.28150  ORF Transcript_10003/g.28150 Transcript_10003/m.28150 type:complete len:82 (-) Transcript_10003:991-1236(-)